ncbi:MAG: YebC/PmpR family DNA-binding regulatory protein [Gammaproteobacteria bacterium]|jgi:YebC/PmpR family DNA-binding regulatory protein
MAGHSKWANIQHRKKAQDAKRGKLFTKLIREVTIAARMGGADPGSNSRLRLALDKANGSSVPKDTIDRAIKRGAGDNELSNIEEIRYEGYGPGGVAVMADCMTDNRNRTVAEVRHAFTKCGGNLGTDGSVSYLFSQVGQLSFDDSVEEDALMEAAIEAGADDVLRNDDGSFEVITSPAAFEEVKTGLEAASLAPTEAEVTMRASTSVDLGLDEAQAMLRLLDSLEDLEDVQQVYSNGDISPEVLEALE